MADDDEFAYIHKEYLDQTLNTKITHILKNLQNSVMLCLYMEHTFKRGREMQNFLWVIYGNYFKKTLYQTMQGTFAGI